MHFPSYLRWFVPAAFGCALAACGGAKKDAYIEKPVDDLYNKAMDELVEERYTTAAKTFEEVESQHPYSVWATKSQLMSAYSLYEAGNYGETIIAADRFIQLHPGHRDIVEVARIVDVASGDQPPSEERGVPIELGLRPLDLGLGAPHLGVEGNQSVLGAAKRGLAGPDGGPPACERFLG